ncbi:MAG TPA: phage tail tape measure protein [Methanothrix sp.]|nr:phage tail tape measure protein [Methanothrix sp.]
MKDGLKNGLAGINWTGLGMDTAGDYLRGITAGMGPIGTALDGVATALGPTGLVAVAAVAGGAIIAKAAYDAAAAWEAGMAQISKTTGIEKGSSGFNDLSEDLKDLYATMPTTMSEIQNVAKSAGSLGIEESSIAGYTRVALEMGSAFDIPAEEAAVAVGKVQSQLKKLPEGVEDSAQFARNFGSAVDFAGNSMNATEQEVLDFSTRAAGALSLLGGSAYELAGWGGATASVFSSSQLAAGSFNAALTQLTGTTKGSQEAQEKAAELLGVTSEEFMKLISTDPTDTILRLGNALEELDPAEATKAAGILGGGYGDDFFKKMIGHTDEWRGKIEEVVAAGEKGESIGKSFEAGSKGAKAAMQELKNSISAILIDIGGPIRDAFTPLLGGLAEGLNKIREIGENLWGPLTTVLSPLTTGAGILAEHIGTMAGMSLDALVLASQAISKAFELGGKYAEAVKAEILEIIENSGPFKTVSGYVDDISDAFQRLYDKVADVVSKIADGLSNAIPTALKGTGDALGTLAEKAGLGGVADAAGGVFDFFGDVNARVWGKETGKEYEDGFKEEVEDGELTDAVIKKLTGDEAKDALMKAGKNAADIYGSEFAAQMALSNLTGEELLAMINSQSTPNKKKMIREFEYMDHQYKMLITKGGSGYYTSLYSGDKLLGMKDFLGDYAKLDPVAAFQEITGAPAPEEGTAAYYGLMGDLLRQHQAELAEINAQEPISLWDDPDNQRSWIKYMDENKDLAERAGDEIVYELYNAQAKAIEANDATLQESFSIVMKGLASPGSVSSDLFNMALADIIDAGFVSEGHRAAMQEIAIEDAEEYRKNLVGGMKIELPSLADIIEDPSKIKGSFENMLKFQEGYLIPRISENMEDVNSLLSEGVSEDALYEAYIKPLYAIYEYLPSTLQDLLGDLESGVIDLAKFGELYYTDVAGKIDEKAAAALEDIKSANARFYGEFLSDNASWQNYVNEYGGYIGPTKLYGGYRDAVDAEIAASQAINSKYNIATVGSIGIVAELDTSEAQTATDELVDKIQTTQPTMKLNLDTTAAYTEWGQLLLDLKNYVIKLPVELDVVVHADEIRAMIAEELRACVV